MKKILIANRGEIACRVIRSIKKMGLNSVAVFSEVDRKAPHVLMADQAFCLGAAPSNESYLNIDKILKICKDQEVDGIHPGYGFLSENAEFAKRVTNAGITFIGPSPAAIRTMGSKLSAKKAVKKFNIPMVPGTDQPIDDVDKAIEIAQDIGFPILIKASAGGGGKGMRLVESSNMLAEQLQLATSEAKSAFGNGSVFIEKYVLQPRHIEIQVLADNHGNIVHLFERECSIQRRHQKLIEEAPSVVLSAELRSKMGNAAIDVARSCNYSGAGTVEFLLDQEANFYFLEMNTRLQVEHPVTELISGIDLVEQQIKIAQGEKLSFTQDDLKIDGHAIELRIYAEDPKENFAPSIGTLVRYKTPIDMINVRVDDGFREGMEVPIYYDPILSKLISFGSDRASAIDKMIQAIDAFKIEGIQTTLSFGKFVMQHDSFINGNIDTGFVKKYFNSSKNDIKVLNPIDYVATAAAKLIFEQSKDKSYLTNQ